MANNWAPLNSILANARSQIIEDTVEPSLPAREINLKACAPEIRTRNLPAYRGLNPGSSGRPFRSMWLGLQTTHFWTEDPCSSNWVRSASQVFKWTDLYTSVCLNEVDKYFCACFVYNEYVESRSVVLICSSVSILLCLYVWHVHVDSSVMEYTRDLGV